MQPLCLFFSLVTDNLTLAITKHPKHIFGRMAMFLKINFYNLSELIGSNKSQKPVIRIQEIPIPHLRCIRRGTHGPEGLGIDSSTMLCN